MTKGQRASKITQETLMPLTLIGSLLYIIFHVGMTFNRLEANTSKIEAMQIADRETLKTLKSMELRQMKMETTLELLAK